MKHQTNLKVLTLPSRNGGLLTSSRPGRLREPAQVHNLPKPPAPRLSETELSELRRILCEMKPSSRVEFSRWLAQIVAVGLLAGLAIWGCVLQGL